jgi:hypothetical protein
VANQQNSNPPTAAYYLTLIGGILGLLLGAGITVFLFFTIILWPLGVWVLIANALMITYAMRLMNQPNEHSKYGTYILILSILSGVNLLCLIGGILALAYQPTPTAAQPYQPQPYAPYTQPAQYAPATTKFCPQCGNPVGGEAQYCPKCGTKIPQ